MGSLGHDIVRWCGAEVILVCQVICGNFPQLSTLQHLGLNRPQIMVASTLRLGVNEYMFYGTYSTRDKI